MFRIRQVGGNKFVVEQSKTNWLGKVKWIPFVKTSGLDRAWEHSSIEFARMNLVDEVLKNVEYQPPSASAG